MVRSNLYFKVELEHDESEKPEDLGAQICRQIEKFFGVRIAELASITRVEE